MSLLIHHFVVHQLIASESEPMGSKLVPKNHCFEVTRELEEFALQLHQVFSGKPGKGVGAFVQAEATQQESEFPQLLSHTMEQSLTFIDFSVQASQLLQKALHDNQSSESGFVVFSQYEYLATDYLMVVLLNIREHMQVTRELELTRSHHLDLAKMQLAVRIDLTQLKIQPEQRRYISFIKGRMGRKVSDFFMQFIHCEELLDVKQQNKQLVQCVDEYLAAEQLDPQEKHASREALSAYYKDQVEHGEPIKLDEVAEQLPKSAAFKDFTQFSQQAEQPLENEFEADPAAMRAFAKFSGQGGGVSLSFERKLYGERVQYDAVNDRLVIQGIPPNLKDQLLRWEKG